MYVTADSHGSSKIGENPRSLHTGIAQPVPIFSMTAVVHRAQQLVHVVRVLFLHFQDALHHAAGSDVWIGIGIAIGTRLLKARFSIVIPIAIGN